MSSSQWVPESGQEHQPEGALRLTVENAMVSLFKQYYGKGPAAAKALMRDEYVVVVLEDGLTRGEETLLEAGQEEEVRRFRLAFEQSVSEQAKRAISQATGRAVISYHSQVTFHPFRAVEFFVLETGLQAS
jgi:uncharacterized protein YbcI